MSVRALSRSCFRLLPSLLLCLLVTAFVVLVVEFSTFFSQTTSFTIGLPTKLSQSIVFPSVFRVPKGEKDLVSYYLRELNGLLLADSHVYNYQGPSNPLTATIKNHAYHNKNISLFQGPVELCEGSLVNVSLAITNATQLRSGTDELAERLLEQLRGHEAFRELQPFFKSDLGIQLAVETTQDHFFKFAGSSVFLKQYGVHLMVSRVIYSTTGNKRKITTSLIYAQVFDQDWNEIKDIELVVPFVDHRGERKLNNVKFPQFLPIPFFHDVNHLRKRFYGPEDPRLILRKNRWGDDEPVIVYNAFQRKVHTPKLPLFSASYKHTRLIFLAWPFRSQKGKNNVQNAAHEFDDVTYTKTSELLISGTKRLGTQKNWSPMLNSFEAERDGYHENIYFLYRWSDLSILKCSLEMDDGNAIPCRFDFVSDDNSKSNKVGPLRGGTELININDILHKHVVPSTNDKQVWIGFPRTHINGCGCGKSMYRPNLAVVIKEAETYRVTHLSSFTSLGIEVTGWSDPNNVCAKGVPNVLLPNGFSSWTMEEDTDYLTLTLSVADSTNHVLHIKGLLSTLMKNNNILQTLPRGDSDKLIACSIAKSVDFCEAYGEETKKFTLSQVPQ